MGARAFTRVVAVAVVLLGWGAPVMAAPLPPPPPLVLEPDLPPGIAWAALGWAEVEVPDGAELRFERVPVPAFANTGLWEAAGPGVLVTERGRLVVVDDRIGETVYDAGRFHALGQGALIGVRNDEPEDAVFLRLTVVDAGAAAGAAPAAQDRGPETEVAPLAFVAPVPGGASTPVADADAPPTPALLFLASVTWSGGLAADDDGPLLTHAGPLGLVLDEGLLEVAAPSGAPARLATGQCVVFAPGAVHRSRPAGGEAARAYALGLVGADQADAGVLVLAEDALDMDAMDAAPKLPPVGRCD